ncbi:MAG TPA: hypothetical protein PKY77_26805, partial [Phycisphaerae bacterium]|nr:hypothetical protein [Phycisphaerae bacterium]HRY71520.1 hypothetical protein [Phycisphaerae bacterium]
GGSISPAQPRLRLPARRQGEEARMFLRAHHRTKDGKPHTYFTLVESKRTERGPRQRIVAELGELSADEQRRWQRTAIFHTRHEDSKQLPLFLDEEVSAHQNHS